MFGTVYKKHYPPGLEDEVWRLDKIGKDGAFHKRLAREGINNVEGFLRLYVMAPAKLRTVCDCTFLALVGRISMFYHSSSCISPLLSIVSTVCKL